MSGQAQSAQGSPSPAQSQAQPHAHAQPHHGNTVAAWTAVGILILGFLVMAFGVALTSVWVFVVGAVVAVAGVVAGKVLSLAGYGKPRPDVTDHGAAVR